MKILKLARALLEYQVLCDHCLGRQFALLAHGLTNKERGQAIKLLLVAEGHRLALQADEEAETLLRMVETKGFSEIATKTMEIMGLETNGTRQECYLCDGKFESLDDLARQIANKLTCYEFRTFLIGARIPPKVEDREDEVRAKFDVRWAESLRNEFSREMGKRVMKITGKSVDHERPDILVIANPFSQYVTLEVNSLFISGRYRKLIRGIPQAKWICRECQGQGCSNCNWTGKMYQESVEELIGGPILKKTEGVGIKFHAAGREDTDARVLGTGRPFVIEVKKPKKRFVDLDNIMKKVNRCAQEKVEINNLSYSSKEDVRKIKAKGQAQKVYRVTVEFRDKISDNDISRIEEQLSGKLVHQMTPRRVRHRRSEKTRKKYLYGVKVKRIEHNIVEMLVQSQGGLYIKELITGDEGGTTPSVSEITNTSAKCIKLDVLDVSME